MAPDRRPPNPGITEYKNPDLTVRFTSTRSNSSWEQFGISPTIPEAEAAAARLLSGKFVERTTAAMRQPLTDFPASIDASLIQQGRKNCIYLVNANEREFVLVMSRGDGQAAEDTIHDYYNLNFLRLGLEERGFDVFVPRPFMLYDVEGFSGFSIEYLKDHDELGMLIDPDLIERGKLVPRFRMNSSRAEAKKYNKAHPIQSSESNPDSLADDERINALIISKLLIAAEITHSVPAEFLINAGDFMANPDASDFDLKLITIRGGWKELSAEEIARWIFTHQENAIFTSSAGERLFVPFRPFNQAAVVSGLALAQKEIAEADARMTSLSHDPQIHGEAR